MRAAPPLQVNVERFDFWNALLAGLAVLILLVACSWFASSRSIVPPWAAWLMGSSTIAALLALLASARRVPVGLRWDSQHWYCGRYGDSDEEDGPWRARVAVDLGGFMLLRLEPPDVTRRLMFRCLPVQRSGVRGDWHALRCAVSAHGLETAHPAHPQ